MQILAREKQQIVMAILLSLIVGIVLGGFIPQQTDGKPSFLTALTHPHLRSEELPDGRIVKRSWTREEVTRLCLATCSYPLPTGRGGIAVPVDTPAFPTTP